MEKFEGYTSRSKPVKITKGLDKALEEFLQTDIAQAHGFRYKSDVVNAAVRELLIRYDFPKPLKKTE